MTANRYATDVLGASIVAVGSFNPPIFSPAWLLQHNLIGTDDAAGALQDEEHVISRQITRYRAGAFLIQVMENQLSIAMNGAITPALRDLASGIFSTLSHTPVTAVGLNFYGHFKISDIKDYHRIGDVLAPKNVWSTAFGTDAEHLGMAEITVVKFTTARSEREPSSPATDMTRVTVQPSSKVHPGIFIQVNDHHVIEKTKEFSAAQLAALSIENNWSNMWGETSAIFNRLLTSALA